jgi:alpha-L-fucosidase
MPDADDASLQLDEGGLAWWHDAKFGLFVHFGLYSLLGRGEWVMFNEQIPAEEYRKLANEFQPSLYDPQQWAELARAVGMRYAVLTARHHDGFALWESPGSVGAFDAPRHAAQRDLVRPFVDAVRAAGLRVGLYYSPMDWRFPGYFRPDELPDDLESMKQQTHEQILELVSRYGPLDILWYDGAWLAHRGTDADAAWLWEPAKLNRMVRSHQPNVVISPRSGWIGDFAIDEGGHDVNGPIRPEPWEKCVSVSSPIWGYAPDAPLLSSERLLRLFIDTIVRGGNFLLNVGPDGQGVIPPQHTERLRAVGSWLEGRGEAVFGTRAGPLQPVDGQWGTTQAGDRVFLWVLRWPPDGAPLTIPVLAREVVGARVLPQGSAVWQRTETKLSIAVEPADRDAVATLVELSLKQPTSQ